MEMKIPTPHINAKKGEFADTVLFPGDPLRAKYIAEKYLSNVQQINEVRNMFAFTGEYNGKRISIMGSGMGIPSASIYAKELYVGYDVKNIVRIGSCGALHEDVKLGDVIIGMGASTDSNVNRQRFSGFDFAAIADYELLERAVNAAKAQNKPVKVGNIFSADLFYTPDFPFFHKMAELGIMGVEMEAAGLYGVAAECGKKALAMCTVSDHIIRGEAMPAEERQTTFHDMMEIALELA